MKNNISNFEHGYALLIGIRYGNSDNPLNGTLKDIEALGKHFRHPKKAAYKAENIIELTEEKAINIATLILCLITPNFFVSKDKLFQLSR